MTLRAVNIEICSKGVRPIRTGARASACRALPPMPPNGLPPAPSLDRAHGASLPQDARARQRFRRDRRARARRSRSMRARVRALADRRTGIGCDQLILIGPGTAHRRDDADLERRRLRGRRLRQRHALRAGPGRPRLHDRDRRRHPRRARCDGDGATVDMGAAALRLGRDPARLCDGHRCGCRSAGGRSSGRRRSMSAIRISSSSSPMPTRSISPRIGPEIENDPLFPERINVNVAADPRARPCRDADVGARRRPHPRLRHRRLRHLRRRPPARPARRDACGSTCPAAR